MRRPERRFPGLSLAAFVALAGCGTPPEPPPPAWIPSPPPPTSAPAGAAGPLDLPAAIGRAMKEAPLVRAARSRVDAAEAGTDLAQTAYLPRLDLLWQTVRATRNNVAGTSMPQFVVPPVSGPVTDKSWDDAWGTTAGLLFTWEPFDFGLRSAQVGLTRLASRLARTEVEAARLEAGCLAAESFIAWLAAREARAAVKSNVDRWEVIVRSVRAKVAPGLQPGADLSRAEAELAAAQNALIRADQAVQDALLLLGLAVHDPGTPPEPAPGPLLSPPADEGLENGVPLTHPWLARHAASLELARGRTASLDSAGLPRVNLQFSFGGRGSGFDGQGETGDAADGLYPDHGNWAAGIQFLFPLSDRAQIGARRRADEAAEREELARGDQTYLELKVHQARLRNAYEAAERIAKNMPVQVKAAGEAYTRARTRLEAGLGTVGEVAEAQRLLAQSEIDAALSTLALWRVLAAAARIRGSFDAFLAVVERSKAGR